MATTNIPKFWKNNNLSPITSTIIWVSWLIDDHYSLEMRDTRISDSQIENLFFQNKYGAKITDVFKNMGLKGCKPFLHLWGLQNILLIQILTNFHSQYLSSLCALVKKVCVKATTELKSIKIVYGYIIKVLWANRLRKFIAFMPVVCMIHHTSRVGVSQILVFSYFSNSKEILLIFPIYFTK